MRRSNSLKHRVREMEEAHGAGALTLEFADGSRRGFNLQRNDRLKVLIASFDIARAARNPAAPRGPASEKAIQVARLIGKAEQITPRDRLWDTVRGLVQGAEEDARNCDSHAPDPASS